MPMVDGNGLEKPALHFCGNAAQWNTVSCYAEQLWD